MLTTYTVALLYFAKSAIQNFGELFNLLTHLIYFFLSMVTYLTRTLLK